MTECWCASIGKTRLYMTPGHTRADVAERAEIIAHEHGWTGPITMAKAPWPPAQPVSPTHMEPTETVMYLRRERSA